MDSKNRGLYNAILRTVCYADIFNYPLREEEVERWVIGIKQVNKKAIKKANGVIYHKDQFMFLAGREKLLTRRTRREAISEKKLTIAKRVTSFLRHIPTVKLVGVSGSVAMHNAKEDDDIDVFIIAQSGTLWLTRLLTTLVVELFATRRRPHDTNVSNKICLNMFVDEMYLAIPKERQNVYTAHEVCQLRVLFDRDNTYQRFLLVNEWVREYLPNALARGAWRVARERNYPRATSYVLRAIDLLSKHAQLLYMQKHRTTETISEGVLAFHPKDYTRDVLTAFEKRVALYASQV